MNYEACLEFLFSQLPIFQRQGQVAFKNDLSNTIKLCDHIGNPQKNLKCIHVAGTNGKGSVCHMLASVYQTEGYKTGLYTSPHLTDFRERIKVCSQLVEKDFVVEFVNKNQAFISQLKPSFFELTVAMAFKYFEEQKVEIAIIETGMGGRLDSTNIITALLSIITNIGLDHQQYLGDTLEKIATEKAGIIKTNCPVLIGKKQQEISHVFVEKAKPGKVIFAEDFKTNFVIPEIKEKPVYQKENAQTAVSALELLKVQFPISQSSISLGISEFERISGLRARWQILNKQPYVVAEGAHNSDGLMQLNEQLARTKFKKLFIVYGTVNDKDLTHTLKLLPKKAEYFLCNANIPRALASTALTKIFLDSNFKAHNCGSCKSALKQAFSKAKKEDLVLVTGSLFVIAEVLAFLETESLT